MVEIKAPRKYTDYIKDFDKIHFSLMCEKFKLINNVINMLNNLALLHLYILNL